MQEWMVGRVIEQEVDVQLDIVIHHFKDYLFRESICRYQNVLETGVAPTGMKVP